MLKFNPTKIKERRLKLKKSRAKLAKEIGVSPTGIYFIEKGRKIPKANMLGLLATALRCKVDYFFDKEDQG